MVTKSIVAEDAVVYKTNNYDLFAFDEANRRLDKGRIASMAEGMEASNWLKYYPILVNSDGVIYDGQHRFSAARLIQADVYYIVGEDIDIIDVAATNALTKNWSNWDYLNFWIEQGKEDYQKLHDYVNQFTHISLASGMHICSNQNTHGAKGVFNTFRSGLWEFGDSDKANEVGEIVNIISQYMRVGMNQAFSRAVKVIVYHEQYNSKRFRSQLERGASWLRPSPTQRDATFILQDIYNYNMKKDRVSFVRA